MTGKAVEPVVLSTLVCLGRLGRQGRFEESLEGRQGIDRRCLLVN